MPQGEDFAASAKDPMKLILVKGSNLTSEAGFCCLCQGPDETDQDQRQQTCRRMQDFAASAEDPMKLSKTKGSKHAAGCRILLPLPEILAAVKSKKRLSHKQQPQTQHIHGQQTVSRKITGSPWSTKPGLPASDRRKSPRRGPCRMP